MIKISEKIRELIKDIEKIGAKVYITVDNVILYRVVIDYGQYIVQYFYEEDEIYNYLNGFYYGVVCQQCK